MDLNDLTDLTEQVFTVKPANELLRCVPSFGLVGSAQTAPGSRRKAVRCPVVCVSVLGAWCLIGD